MIPIGVYAKAAEGSVVVGDDPALQIASLLSAFDARVAASIAATGGLVAGNPVNSWTPVAGSNTAAATQSGGTRPVLSGTASPGWIVPRCAAGQHLTQSAGGAAVVTVCALIRVPASAGGGAGPILTRDTSATSDFPAYEVRGA